MTARCQIPDCGRPASGGFICTTHATSHDRLLAELDDLAHALDAAYLKAQQFSIARIVATRDDTEQEEAPLPYEPAAGQLRRRLSAALLGTVHAVARHHGEPVTLTPTTRWMAGYLHDHRAWFRTHPDGPVVVDRFASLAAKARVAVDRPADLVFLGICSHPAKDGQPFELRRNGRVLRYHECPEDLYADATKPTVRCPRCKTEHPVERRRAVLMDALNDQLAHAVDIARGLSALGMHVTPDRIRQWKARGRLVERGPEGRPLYRVGDVIDLVLADQQRDTTTRNPKETR